MTTPIEAALEALDKRKAQHEAEIANCQSVIMGLREKISSLDETRALLIAAAAPKPRAKKGAKEEKILTSLIGVMDISALAQVTGYPRDLLHEPLRRLVKAGKIVAEGKAFRLPIEGYSGKAAAE